MDTDILLRFFCGVVAGWLGRMFYDRVMLQYRGSKAYRLWLEKKKAAKV